MVATSKFADGAIPKIHATACVFASLSPRHAHTSTARVIFLTYIMSRKQCKKRECSYFGSHFLGNSANYLEFFHALHAQ